MKEFSIASRYVHVPLYHISFRRDLEGVWAPRPPDGDADPVPGEGTMYPEPKDPRISLAPSLAQCFQGVYANVKHLFKGKQSPPLEFHVYTPALRGSERIVTPEALSHHRLIHDAHITEEHCLLTPVRMNRVSRIQIYPPNPNDKLYYYAFGEKADEFYGWLPSPIKVGVLGLETLTDVPAQPSPSWCSW